jgi:hypothetical protein
MKTQKRFRKHPRVVLPYPWYSEDNLIKAGESAFGIGVKFHNNPFSLNPFRSYWIRGFKRAEKAHNDRVRFSIKAQESIGYEEVEA